MKKNIIKLLGIVAFSSAFLGSLNFNDKENVEVNAATEEVKAQVQKLNGPAYDLYDGDYYKSITATSGKALRDQLHTLIRNWDTGSNSYDTLYTTYLDSDLRPDGTIWDTYGDFSFPTSKKAGNYSKEGDCYNREHSIPASWFKDRKPMYYDAFHLMPTDGYINNRRSNDPFGEFSGNGSYHYTFNNYVSGTSKSNGSVFEPADCYKGDYARNYFYFITCYYTDEIYESAGSSFFNRSAKDTDKQFGLTISARDLLIKWHNQDPVSQKEVNRCNGVSLHQKNRNPFIDHPEMVEAIWGDGSYTGGGGGTTTGVPEISIRTQLGGGDITMVTSSSIELTVDDVVNVLPYIDGNRDDSVTHTVIGNGAIEETNQCYNGKHPVITAKAPGTGSVTFTKSYEDKGTTKTVSKTLTIQVKPKSGGTGGGTTTGKDYPVNITGYTLLTDVNTLQEDDFVVVTTDIESGKGLTGSGSGKATYSTTKSDWRMYLVKISGSNHYLFDQEKNAYIASVSSNSFAYGEAANFTVNEDGVLSINGRYLQLNGDIARFYSSINNSYSPFKVFKVNYDDGGDVPPIIEVELLSLSYEGNYKTNYYVGEVFDHSGLTIKANYSDGSSEDVTSEISWPTNPLSLDDTSISISFENKVVSLPIFVTQRQSDEKVLTSISFEGSYKTTYKVGDVFDYSNLTIFANYSDGSKEDITTQISWPDTPLKEGDEFVVISFEGNSVNVPISVSLDVDDEEEEEFAFSLGCVGSILSSSMLLFVITILGTTLLLKKKSAE